MSPGWSIVGGADADNKLAAVVGTDIRGDNISGAPSGVPGERNCCAVRPGIAGDSKRDSAACAKRLHSSSHAIRCESDWTNALTSVVFGFFVFVLMIWIFSCAFC